jgi:hypothetical protein
MATKQNKSNDEQMIKKPAQAEKLYQVQHTIGRLNPDTGAIMEPGDIVPVSLLKDELPRFLGEGAVKRYVPAEPDEDAEDEDQDADADESDTADGDGNPDGGAPEGDQ